MLIDHTNARPDTSEAADYNPYTDNPSPACTSLAALAIPEPDHVPLINNRSDRLAAAQMQRPACMRAGSFQTHTNSSRIVDKVIPTIHFSIYIPTSHNPHGLWLIGYLLDHTNSLR